MLNYKTNGTGEKQIIFIHGNSQSSEYWDDVLNSPLKNNYKLIALDLPGCGDSFVSENPANDYSIKGLAQHVKEFISQFDKTDYIIVATSLGANIVGEIINELKNCKGVMLTSSSAIGLGLTVNDIIKPNPNVAAFFMAEPSDEQINALIEDVAYNLLGTLKDKAKRIFKSTDPNFRTFMAESVTKADYSDELQNLKDSKLPIAVVFGEQDKLCFTDYLDKVPFPKWNNKTILLPDSGHCSMLDQPQTLTKIIGEFAEDCF